MLLADAGGCKIRCGIGSYAGLVIASPLVLRYTLGISAVLPELAKEFPMPPLFLPADADLRLE